MIRILLLGLFLVALSACAQEEPAPDGKNDPYVSQYQALPSQAVLIRGASVLSGTGEAAKQTDVLLSNGKIKDIGQDLSVDDEVLVVEAKGKWLTPGIIDVHSHLGVYPSPSVNAHSDGNEASAPVTAAVWAEHSLWPQDPGFAHALAGGVTAMQVLPGSANLIGGRSVTIKNVPAQTVQEMKFPGAPYGLKMACGENPKRVYGNKGGAPSTRMGNVAGYRAAWIKAASYKEQQDAAERGEGEAPDRDLELDTLAGVLRGEILVHNHCYRADEMAVMLNVAKEFDYKVTAFHHAVEAYKIADLLAENQVCAAMWADWWGFKMEAFDGIRENVGIVDAAGKSACAIVHSDSAIGIQRLNQEAAKSLAAARRAGLDISEGQAMRWISSNPAKALGIDDQTGSIEPGKNADVVVWDKSPFSVYAHAELVFIDGARVFDRSDPDRQPVSDFTLGTRADAGAIQ